MQLTHYSQPWNEAQLSTRKCAAFGIIRVSHKVNNKSTWQMTATVCAIHISVCHSDSEVLRIKQAAKNFDTFSKRDRSQTEVQAETRSRIQNLLNIATQSQQERIKKWLPSRLLDPAIRLIHRHRYGTDDTHAAVVWTTDVTKFGFKADRLRMLLIDLKFVEFSRTSERFWTHGLRNNAMHHTRQTATRTFSLLTASAVKKWNSLLPILKLVLSTLWMPGSPWQ